MDSFCSQYLYFSMLALLSDLLNYSQLLVWMPWHIFFQHCTKVCLQRLLQGREFVCALSSARLTWPIAQGSTYREGLPCECSHSEQGQTPLRYLYRGNVYVHPPSSGSQWPVRSENREGKLPRIMVTCYWEVSTLLRWGSFQPKHCLWTGLQVNNFSCHFLACAYFINVFLTRRWWGREDLPPLPLLLSTFFHTATPWYPRGRLHCNLPPLVWPLCTLLPPPRTSPWHFILPPVPPLPHSVCYY